MGSSARVDLLGRAVDDFAGPVAGVGDDYREALVAAVRQALDGFACDGALLVDFGWCRSERVGDDAKGMGFFERSVGEADSLPEVDFAVVKVEFDAVGRKNFGFDVAETHARPGVSDKHGGDEEHPPGGVTDEEVAEGLVRERVVGGVGGLQHDLGPEEADHGPAHEAVRVLEGVVHQHADARVGEDEHDHEHGDDGVAEEVDVTADGVERTLLGAVVHGEKHEVDGIPERSSHGTARVKTAIGVDLGRESAGPKGENLGPCTEDPEESVDDVLVADDDGHQDVGSDGSGSLLVGEDGAVLDTRADDEPHDSRSVSREGQAEDASVDRPKVPSEVAVEAVALLGRQGRRV